MLVFKILVIVTFLFCIANVLFTIHMLVSCNKMIGSVQNWAEEIDKANSAYIRQEFAKLRYDNNLIIKEEKDEQGNDFSFTEDDEEK